MIEDYTIINPSRTKLYIVITTIGVAEGITGKEATKSDVDAILASQGLRLTQEVLSEISKIYPHIYQSYFL